MNSKTMHAAIGIHTKQYIRLQQNNVLTDVSIEYICNIQQWHIQHIKHKSEWIRKRCLRPLASTPRDCMRVLITSSGVVTNAAGTPAISPATKSSSGPVYIYIIWYVRGTSKNTCHTHMSYDIWETRRKIYHMIYERHHMMIHHMIIYFLSYIWETRRVIWCMIQERHAEKYMSHTHVTHTDCMHSTYSSRTEYIECIESVCATHIFK